MKYLKLFNQHTDYETFKASQDYIEPNVSYCINEDEVHYNPKTVDPYNGHAYVEIGGLKWATMNVGATSETDTGLYFHWGDTQGYTASQVGSGEGQKYFGLADYKYSNGTTSDMTKYNATDGKTVLDIEDDAARVNWGGEWRMPTTTELQTLGNAVNAVWTENYNGSGVNGILCTDKTDSSKKLFFPAAGYAHNGSIYRVGYEGYVWSSSINSDYVNHAWRLSFDYEDSYWGGKDDRYNGYSVRGVVGSDSSGEGTCPQSHPEDVDEIGNVTKNASNFSISIDDGALPEGTYSMVYEDSTGTPLEGVDEITNFTIN